MRDLIWSIIIAYCIGLCVSVMLHPRVFFSLTVEYFVLLVVLCYCYGLTVVYIICY